VERNEKEVFRPKRRSYPDYGGRGIVVCDRWLDEKEGFSNFFSDMGVKPTLKHSLERNNVNGNYEPSNCRWATSKQQAGNTRRNHWIEYKGEKMILEDWARKLSVSKNTILRWVRNKTPFEYQKSPSSLILDTQNGIFYYSIKEAAQSRNYTYQNLVKRLNGSVTNDTPFIKA
jgi:hypothetical protein